MASCWLENLIHLCVWSSSALVTLSIIRPSVLWQMPARLAHVLKGTRRIKKKGKTHFWHCAHNSYLPSPLLYHRRSPRCHDGEILIACTMLIRPINHWNWFCLEIHFTHNSNIELSVLSRLLSQLYDKACYESSSLGTHEPFLSNYIMKLTTNHRLWEHTKHSSQFLLYFSFYRLPETHSSADPTTY